MGLPVVAHVDAKADAEGPSCQAYGQPAPAEGEPAALLASRIAQGEHKVYSGAGADNIWLCAASSTQLGQHCHLCPGRSAYLHANMSHIALSKPFYLCIRTNTHAILPLM